MCRANLLIRVRFKILDCQLIRWRTLVGVCHICPLKDQTGAKPSPSGGSDINKTPKVFVSQHESVDVAEFKVSFLQLKPSIAL